MAVLAFSHDKHAKMTNNARACSGRQTAAWKGHRSTLEQAGVVHLKAVYDTFVVEPHDCNVVTISIRVHEGFSRPPWATLPS